jgi:hypothetical protein
MNTKRVLGAATATAALCAGLAGCATRQASPARVTIVSASAAAATPGSSAGSAETAALRGLTATVDPSITNTITLDSGAITMEWAGAVPRPKVSPAQAYAIGKRELASPGFTTYCRFGKLTVRDITDSGGRLYNRTQAWMCFATGVPVPPPIGGPVRPGTTPQPSPSRRDGRANIMTFLSASTGRIFFTQINGY